MTKGGPTNSRPRSAPSDTPTPALANRLARERRGRESMTSGRRASLTLSACTRCRTKKAKCDGKRPTCGRCKKQSLECVFDVAREGMTRHQDRQQRLEARNDEVGRLTALFNAMRNSSDLEATTLLARLRMGESLDDLIESLNGVPVLPSDSQPVPDMTGWTASWRMRTEFDNSESSAQPKHSFGHRESIPHSTLSDTQSISTGEMAPEQQHRPSYDWQTHTMSYGPGH